LGNIILSILAKFSGSFSRIHSNFGAVKPAKAMLPVSSDSVCLQTTSLRYAVCFSVRPSFHNMQGRITSPCLSNATSPCICPPKEMPLTYFAILCELTVAQPQAPQAPQSLSMQSNSASTLFRATIQSEGFCSVQPFCGYITSYVADAWRAILPRSSVKIPFIADVPRSIPM